MLVKLQVPFIGFNVLFNTSRKDKMVKLELSLIVISMSTFLTEKLDPFTNHKVI